MGEAVAAVGLVASILQLVDFGSKLVGRVNEFVASTKDVPETFRNITVQLPLAIATLQRFRSRIERDELSINDSHALKALVDRSNDLIRDANGLLEKTIPPKISSSFEKRLLAIRSLRYDKKLQHTSAQLLENVNYLTLFQTTQIPDSATDPARRLSGTIPFAASLAASFQLGLNLSGAPHLAEGNFVGRDAELEQLNGMLDPHSPKQSLVAVVGMAGIGKTQLCIEYAIRHQEQYSSIFWLDARDESSFRADLLNIAEVILPDQASMLTTKAHENTLIQKIRQWFSHSENRKWLLILDNYDNPKVPGDEDPLSFDIKKYLPHRSQGLVLITTRSRKIKFAKQLHLQKLETVEQGLEILCVRSGRDFQDDHDARDLIKRMDGLPLALASAASFLERTSCTAKEYLDAYERNWLEEEPDILFEYGDRTLFTTWNLSLEKLKSQSPETAEILRILAFFGSEKIDYYLLGAPEPVLWPGTGDILRSKAAFDRSMARLRDYSLIEISHKSYRLHPCLHDWTLSNLNRRLRERDVWLAVKCLILTAESNSSIWSTNYDDSLSRLAPHALRLTHPRLFEVLMKSGLDEWHSAALCGLGQLLHRADRNHEAVQLVLRSFEWSREHLGPEHQDSLIACNVLGLIHQGLRNFTEAENLLKRAAFGFERTVGRYNKRTLDPVHNLAVLYMQLGKLTDAEDMYLWSLRGCEESYGLQNPNTFWATMALADFYMAKGELDLAEREFLWALKGFDTVINADHFFSRFTAARLGRIYQRQEKYLPAAAMYQRVYESCIRLLGPDSWITHEAQADMNSFGSKYLASLSDPRILERTLSLLRQGSLDPSRPSCHDCNIPLTATTQRFVCCTCADHELCGGCRDELMTRAAMQKGESGDHIFLPCDSLDSSSCTDRTLLRSQNPDLLWEISKPIFIMGKPGSGKSTLSSVYTKMIAELPSTIPSDAAQRPIRDQSWGFLDQSSGLQLKQSARTFHWTKLAIENAET